MSTKPFININLTYFTYNTLIVNQIYFFYFYFFLKGL